MNNLRLIKFRGKGIDTVEWVFGNYSYNGKYHFIDRYVIDNSEVEPSSVGQFTGLIDRHGKEVFEGDVIKYLDVDNNLITLRNSAVEYYKGCFVYSLVNGKNQLLGTTDMCDFEVIGNVFDNPELLKGGKE